MSGERKLVVDMRARALMARLPDRVAEDIVRQLPSGWKIEFVPTETVSDGDGSHPPSSEALAALADAEVYYGYGFTPKHFAAQKQLKWIHSAAAGVGSVMFPEFVASDIVLTNAAGIHAVPMAEYTVAALLHFWRGLDITQDQQRRSEWSKEALVRPDSPAREVSENTVVILGAGGIGQEVAVRLTALGATCVGVRRRIEAGLPKGFASIVSFDDLDAVLPQADALVITAPLTERTRGLINGERLDKLPAHAVLVNVARGAIVDEAALTERLVAGRLRGAALDVFQTEPLAQNSPLWQLRRALVTPHISPVTTTRLWDRQGALFLDNFRRYVSGLPLRNVVNKREGY